MTVYSFGSINVDLFYRVPHLPVAGETLPAVSHQVGLGGKGANQSVAAARAGSSVVHIGMIGHENDWVRDRLAGFGVDVAYIGTTNGPTGQAVIMVDTAGENTIVTYAGVNYEQSFEAVERALETATPGDVFLFQNEVSLKAQAVRLAREKGLMLVYSAAPFQPDAVKDVLPFVNLLVLNEIEAEQLSSSLGLAAQDIPVPSLLVTRGAKGATLRLQETGEEITVPAFPADAVDTTGAGDCFIGYTVAGLDQGLSRAEALRLGAAAAALHVTRHGTSDAVPARAEVDEFLARVPAGS